MHSFLKGCNKDRFKIVALKMTLSTIFLILLPLTILSLWIPIFYSAVSASSDSDSNNNPEANDGAENGVFNSNNFRIAGYLPDYRFGMGNSEQLNQSAVHLDDLYLFSISPQPSLGRRSMFKMCCLNNDHYTKARKAREYKQINNKNYDKDHNYNLKLWLTIGGGGRSDGYLEVINNNKQQDFVDGLIDLVKEQELDGIDFDCEMFRNQEDYENYLKLISYSAKILHKNGIQVSVALHVRQTLPKPVYETIDRINLMTYDMLNREYHAAFPAAKEGIKILINSGCPPYKIFFGLPAYGRHSHNYQDVKTYGELISDIIIATSDIEKDNDKDYLYKKHKVNNYMFESLYAVESKVKYAKKIGLGGIFFWEVGQDKHDEERYPGGMLLNTAARVNSNKVSNLDYGAKPQKVNHQKQQTTITTQKEDEL